MRSVTNLKNIYIYAVRFSECQKIEAKVGDACKRSSINKRDRERKNKQTNKHFSSVPPST